MKVALIGAGFVGTALINELANRGHEVKVIVRSPEKVNAPQGNVNVVKGDVLSDELSPLLKGSDVVVSAYNAGWTNPNFADDFINGSNKIQEAVKQAGVKRLIVIGGAGSLYIDGKQLVETPDFPAEYKVGATAARDYLNILKEEKELDWTFFSPAIEMHHGTSGVRKGTYRKGLESPVFDENGRSILSVEDVAVAITDEVENPAHIKQRFTAAY